MSRITPKRIAYSKKAQDGGSAATLIAVIALLIIFYLLFIPPSFRDQILEGNESGTGSTSSSNINQTILKASPGTIAPISAEAIEHNIPAVMLYSTKEAKVLHTQNTVETKASIFGSKQATTYFEVPDLENTENIILTFADTKRKGGLIIKLNGNEIFNGEIKQENPEPIRLEKHYLVKGKNTLEFDTEKPGMMFWRVNKHTLQTIQINGDVKDITQQKSRNIFVVSGTEKSNVKQSILRFTPQCVAVNVGRLNVLVNQHSIYYSVPDCGGRVVIEFTPDVLLEGENTIVFDSEEGNYIVELVRITSELKEVIQPTYYFEIDSETMNNVRDGQTNVMLKMQFVEGSQQKSGRININGRELNIYQREKEYLANINDYVLEGNNAIKITPDTTLEIIKLEVYEE